jgi:hypothetical protein
MARKGPVIIRGRLEPPEHGRNSSFPLKMGGSEDEPISNGPLAPKLPSITRFLLRHPGFHGMLRPTFERGRFKTIGLALMAEKHSTTWRLLTIEVLISQNQKQLRTYRT